MLNNVPNVRETWAELGFGLGSSNSESSILPMIQPSLKAGIELLDTSEGVALVPLSLKVELVIYCLPCEKPVCGFTVDSFSYSFKFQ